MRCAYDSTGQTHTMTARCMLQVPC